MTSRNVAAGHYSDDPNDPPEYYGLLPDLIRPQVIGVTAYQPVGQAHDAFKARTFREAYRELNPDIEAGCEAMPVVFPARHLMPPDDN